MKSLTKNITDKDSIAAFMVVQSMQARMTSAALHNGMTLSTTIGLDDRSVPYLGYAIKYHGEERVVFSGQARLPKDSHYSFIMQVLNGEVVSEIWPPALREVKTSETSEKISYWKRSMTLEHDITLTDHKPNEPAVDALEKVRRISAWVGYNIKGVEIIRVQEGTANPGREDVQRVQFVDMGPRGVVAAVIFKDSAYVPAGERTLGESIQETDRQRESAMATEAACSTAVAVVSSSFSDRFSDAGLSSISPPRMSLARIDQVEKEIMEATAGTGGVEEVMVGGMRAVLPKILNEEEFTALNNEGKNEYLGHIDAIVKLTMVNNFSIAQEDPEAYQKFLDFLKRFLESGVFKAIWEKNHIGVAKEAKGTATLPYYTARSLGMNDNMISRIWPEMQTFLKPEEFEALRLGTSGDNTKHMREGLEKQRAATKAPARKPAAKKAAGSTPVEGKVVRTSVKAAAKAPAKRASTKAATKK